ncbi:MAG: rhodanese-like domain-containing protein [Leptolyngbyaceae cyanobacterium T60_A2020_046]|nr:rhodanese-like domain-containing protein [Leptolyngbyaceae cyanobacterium T60_A2020_046]
MNRLFSFLPKPAPMRPESRVYDLKARLDWGEPALTIIDVRDRATFNSSHVQGAISVPVEELVARITTLLEPSRDIYLYGDTDEESTIAAESLRHAGYQKVSILRGGAAAWKAAGFPIEVTSVIGV